MVWEAADGAQALALFEAHAPELLILEIWMPILNGLEVLERLVACSGSRWNEGCYAVERE